MYDTWISWVQVFYELGYLLYDTYVVPDLYPFYISYIIDMYIEFGLRTFLLCEQTIQF